ncbi:alpha/beta fold hydrolase [Marinoscillum sp. MHG1-6]|uniref:alpha/beta fold hydrolase n=1 Tax=Marinoscillum sp. MHG1-6 TaxID=2959627 RepID=UPI002157929E|nr:alpha/beta hydrolase [Marinoscillum sp. MHG1-6]
MKQQNITITSQNPNSGRQSTRKQSSGQEWIKRGLRVMQHFSAPKTAEIIWNFAVRPHRRKFTAKQVALIERAETSTIEYRGATLTTYRWGSGARKVLLCHGWNSRVADFRRMIETLVEAGFTVEGIDMKAHGQSEGKSTALPEFCEVLQSYYHEHGPYYALVGYSMGGLAAGIVTSELSDYLKPEQLIIISAPPYVRYFFSDLVKKDIGCNEQVYEHMCDLVHHNYDQSIDHFDLREKTSELSKQNITLIYDEDDQTVPFQKGQELHRHYPNATWVHTRQMGHYNIISEHQVIKLITASLLEESLNPVMV